MDLERATETERRITEQILSRKTDLIAKFPLDKYLDYLKTYPPTCGYMHASDEIASLCAEIVKYSDQPTLELYHKLILITLIKKAEDALGTKRIPPESKSAYNAYFDKIISDVQDNTYPEGFYLYPQEKFSKDLGVCRLALVPAGVHILDVRGFSRRSLVKGGLRQFVEGCLFVALQLKGFSPLLEMHIDSRPDSISLSQFNPEGWRRFYVVTAEILRLNPDIKGTFGTSWYFDPKIETISPRLAYIRKMGREYGGKFFYMGSDPQCISDATLKSPTRKRLYEQRRYVPVNYLLVISRNALIKSVASNSMTTTS